MLRTLAKAHDALTFWSFVAATALLGIIFLTYCLEVVLRYLLNSPTSWSGELISYAQCASVFLVMPLLDKVVCHVSISIFIDQLAVRVAATVFWFCSFLSSLALPGHTAWHWPTWPRLLSYPILAVCPQSGRPSAER